MSQRIDEPVIIEVAINGMTSVERNPNVPRQPDEIVAVEQGGHIYALEADHLAAVVDGEAEPLIPADNAIGNAAVLDALWQRMHG